MEKEIIDKLAKEASELVASIHQEYQAEAFKVVFDRLLGAHLEEKKGGKVKAQKGIASASGESRATSGDFAKMIETPWDYSRYSALVESGTWADRAIVVLAAAEEAFGIDRMTPGEIASVLKTQMRIKSVYESNVSREMGSAKHYLARFKDGKAYRYSLTKAGRDRLKELVDERKD